MGLRSTHRRACAHGRGAFARHSHCAWSSLSRRSAACAPGGFSPSSDGCAPASGGILCAARKVSRRAHRYRYAHCSRGIRVSQRGSYCTVKPLLLTNAPAASPLNPRAARVCPLVATKLFVALLIVAVGAAHIYAVTADCFLFAYGGVLGDTLLANFNAENIINNRTTVDVCVCFRAPLYLSFSSGLRRCAESHAIAPSAPRCASCSLRPALCISAPHARIHFPANTIL